MPLLSHFPKSHQVAFNYYRGVIHFVDEDYSAAQECLEEAYQLCHAKATKNIQLILTYLIPTKLLTSSKLPSSALLSQYPGLARLFQPLAQAMRKGDLAAFDTALENGEEEFVKRRIYLTLERGRDVILRNIFRKVFLAGGYEPPKEGETGSPVRRTRVPLDEFAAALQMAGAEVSNGDQGFDYDEVECLIANAIYKVSLPLFSGRSVPATEAIGSVQHSMLIFIAESDERLHCPRTTNRRIRQEWRLPRHGSMTKTSSNTEHGALHIHSSNRVLSHQHSEGSKWYAQHNLPALHANVV